jgi:hypothetical protein
MQKSSVGLIIAALGSLALAGCSSGGSILPASLTTQSIGTTPTSPQAAAVPKVDPACYSLAQRIEMLRKDGVTERLEKASTGKSTSVSVKRASLAQAAELDKANAEFQARCSTLGPRPVQATSALPGTAPGVANSAQVVSANAPASQIAPPVVQQPPR